MVFYGTLNQEVDHVGKHICYRDSISKENLEVSKSLETEPMSGHLKEQQVGKEVRG